MLINGLLFFKCLINQKILILIFNNQIFIYFVELDDAHNIWLMMMEICEHWLSNSNDFFFKLEFELYFEEYNLSLCYFGGFLRISIIWISFVLLAKWLVYFLLLLHLFYHITAWLVCWFFMCFDFVIKKQACCLTISHVLGTCNDLYSFECPILECIADKF
jgi:hypothetical protein